MYFLFLADMFMCENKLSIKCNVDTFSQKSELSFLEGVGLGFPESKELMPTSNLFLISQRGRRVGPDQVLIFLAPDPGQVTQHSGLVALICIGI